MKDQEVQGFTAFLDKTRVAAGDLTEVALKVKKKLGVGDQTKVLFFSDETGKLVDVDLRGTAEEITARLKPAADKPAGPGRPKLGVVSREISLLPRHWDWLALQPGGASVTLRKLVEEAKKKTTGKDKVRQAQDAAYRFMQAMAGDLPGYEEALRALYAGKGETFKLLIAKWPGDVRAHALKLAEAAF